MDIYAPLAERIGMRAIQDELEDLAFAQINPDARESVIARLKFLREKGGDVVTRIADQLKRVLAEEGLDAWVSGREKSPYSVWRKMQRKNVGFEQLSDIMAFRVVVNNVSDCYRALGIIHSRYPVVPGRFKDYMSTPKPNGYRSMHTSVFGPERERIEVQIRTGEMHEIAEFGVAAHWKYKAGGAAKTDGRQYRWLRELLDILEHASNPEEFLEHTKLEMFQDQVFCFTPKGDLIALPRGATLVDFAYAVHSEVGDHCVGAKINGRMMPLRTQLSNGDQVEIITSRAQTPSPTWERFVVTGRARSRIRRYIRSQQRSQFISLGKSILQKAFKHEGYEFSEKSFESRAAHLQLPACRGPVCAGGRGAGLRPRGDRRCLPRAPSRRPARTRRSSTCRGPRRARARRTRRSRSRGLIAGHGGALRRLLPPAAGRPDRRHRHHRQGRDHPHDRLRDAGEFRRHAGALARRALGRQRRCVAEPGRPRGPGRRTSRAASAPCRP